MVFSLSSGKYRHTYFFSPTARLRYRRIKFLRQNKKLKCREKNLLKKYMWKTNTTKMYYLGFAFLEIRWSKWQNIEPEGSFSGVYNSFVNLWYVKNDKNVFLFAFMLLAFPKLLKCWKTTHLKHSIFNTTEKLKWCRLKYSILVKPQN